MNDLRVQDLRRLLRVAETRNLSAAGRSLGESPKQLSRAIQRMEQDLGIRLFHRTTRSVRITSEGEVWVDAARAALESLEQASESLSTSEVAGEVRVQVMSLFGEAFATWAARACVEHPQLRLVVRTSDVWPDMTAEGLDVVMTAVRPEAAGVVVRKLADPCPVLAAHEDYLARRGTPTTVDQLVDHDALLFGPQRTWPLTDGTVTRHVPVQGRLQYDDSRSLQDAMRAGAGIGLAVQPDPPLVHVLPGWRFGPIDLYAAIAPGRRRLSRVRLVVDALEAITRGLRS
jgi:DNA-binding transcriptional LysR family regulator